METNFNRQNELLKPEDKTVIIRALYTEREACEYLRVSSVTLWRERKKGKISFRRVASKIIYLQEDLENYLNRNKREAFGAIEVKNV